MVTIEKEDTNLKTFNVAKVFAEQVLFPLMFDFKRFQRQANFGDSILNNSLEVTQEIRDIQRVNALKAMAETTHDLLFAIASTVNLKGNKAEILKMKELLELTDKIKGFFYDRRDMFFMTEYKNGRTIEIIDRKQFESIKDIIDVIYVNTEILMTRNKLLFDDSKDEYLNDDELKEQIMKEYSEN